MPKETTPELYGLFHFIGRLHSTAKRGMRAALADCPRCHFVMLEGVIHAIEQHGQDGAIYVSDLSQEFRQPMPAISRGLRQLETDGSIRRETDPNDRRKTLVRITPQGYEASRRCEQALNEYFAGVMARLAPEQLAQMMELKDALLCAVEAESAARIEALEGKTDHEKHL